MNQPLPLGRPSNEVARVFANRADWFYREWKARNKREGIKDRGLSDSMRYQSCVYVIEVDGPCYKDRGGPPDAEAVMQLLARPKSRRELD